MVANGNHFPARAAAEGTGVMQGQVQGPWGSSRSANIAPRQALFQMKDT